MLYHVSEQQCDNEVVWGGSQSPSPRSTSILSKDKSMRQVSFLQPFIVLLVLYNQNFVKLIINLFVKIKHFPKQS